MTAKGIPSWSDLKEYSVVLIILDETSQEPAIKELGKELSLGGYNTNVICLNHSAEMLMSDLVEYEVSIDRFSFIDGISTNSNSGDNRIKSLTSPHDIDQLIESVHKVALSGKWDILVVDSLSSLLISHQKHKILPLVNSLKKMSDDGLIKHILIFCIREDGFSAEDADALFGDLQMFVDRKFNFPPEA